MMETLGYGMAVQFKPDGNGGWLYRKDQTAAPLPATKEERDFHVRRFAWMVVSSLPLMAGSIIAMAFLLNWLMPDPTDTQGMLGTIPMGVVALGGTYLYVKWFSHAPARAFANRTPVGPPTSLAKVHAPVLKHMSYGKLALRMLGLMAVTLFGAFTADIADADRPAAVAIAIGLPLVIGLGVGWWFWRVRSGAA